MICDVNGRGGGCRNMQEARIAWIATRRIVNCVLKRCEILCLCMYARRYLPMYCTRGTFGWTALEKTPRLAAGCKMQ